LPNRPTTVWHTGLERTGQALDAIVNDATSQEHLDQIKASAINGDIRYKLGDSNSVTATIKGTFDDNNSDSTLNIKGNMQDEQPVDITAKLRTIKADTKAQYPDIYLQVAGFAGLGLDYFAPGIDQYDGKWIVLTGDYLSETIGDEPAQDEEPLSVAEATEATRAATSTIREYFLTDDSEKAVVELNKYIGKEQVDGVSTFRYKAQFNKDHGKAFCDAFGSSLASTQAFKKLVAADERGDRQKEIVDGCKDGFNNIKSSDTFDVWVDAHYKLIRKIRIHDVDNAKTYVDFGQRYTGGDDVTLFVAYHDDTEKLDVNGTVKFDFKAYSFSSHFEGKQAGEGDSRYTVVANLNGKSSNDAVKPVKPTEATDFRTLMQIIEANASQREQSYQSDSMTEQTDADVCDGTNPYAGACAPSTETRFN
jgi:hypothetical protein